MFNTYLSDPIYERLPWIYLVLVAILVALPIAPVKWVAIAALLMATALTLLLRWTHRRQAAVEADSGQHAMTFIAHRRNVVADRRRSVADRRRGVGDRRHGVGDRRNRLASVEA